MKSTRVKIVQLALIVLVSCSAFAIAQQFLMHQKPFIHHAFICATILMGAAYAVHYLKLTRNIWVKLAIVFSLCGMLLGVFEVFHIFFTRH